MKRNDVSDAVVEEMFGAEDEDDLELELDEEPTLLLELDAEASLDGLRKAETNCIAPLPR